MRLRTFANLTALAAIASLALPSNAQNHNAEAHAGGSATAATVGLPEFPGARIKKTDKSDAQVDMGFSFGDFHLRVVVAGYTVQAPGQTILDFYRKPLSKYGEVLECDHGQPIGPFKKTKTGLTCAENNDSANRDGISTDSHELRAGTPTDFRFVALGKTTGNQTEFAVVLLELPKDK
jgi:hypothetical protein